MSLINDALKRAREAQPKAPPPAPGPEFRPAEPAQASSRGMGTTMIVAIVIAVLALSGIIFLHFWRGDKHAQPAAENPSSTPQVVEAKQLPQPVAVIAPEPAPKPPEAAAPALTLAPSIAQTNPPAPVLKLQAIFFAPGRSSAMINGKTVRAGDVIKGFRVITITENSATLICAGETNLLTLEQ